MKGVSEVSLRILGTATMTVISLMSIERRWNGIVDFETIFQSRPFGNLDSLTKLLGQDRIGAKKQSSCFNKAHL